MLRWVIASLHLLGLGIGLGSVWVRATALRGTLSTDALRRALRADTVWGLAALIWISTGLLRAFAGLEKGAAYYLGNHVFWAKMFFLIVIIALEMRPIVTLTKWRSQLAKGQTVDTTAARAIARISVVQAVLVIAMVFAATAMARGFGSR